jgi:hypothetical protein
MLEQEGVCVFDRLHHIVQGMVGVLGVGEPVNRPAPKGRKRRSVLSMRGSREKDRLAEGPRPMCFASAAEATASWHWTESERGGSMGAKTFAIAGGLMILVGMHVTAPAALAADMA